MKKVLIGCGVVVLILLIGFGYLAYTLWPNVSRLYDEWSAAIETLDALDSRYPFDTQAQTELDAARFSTMLDVRVALGEYFTGVKQTIDESQGQAEDRAPGWVDSFKLVLDQAAPILPQIATHLEQAAMSPQEFSWHTRVFWGALARVDSGVGTPELEPLRGEYKKFETQYEALRREHPDLEPLRDLLAEVPSDVLVAAGPVLAQDLGRVHRALAVTEVDYFYLQRPEQPETASAPTGPSPETPGPR